ncbi:hypothetical protein H2200_010888 [Cladophialophora chaetospira]|uniref:FAD-binding PCMH-type domain-containing protein n=1 Tax=Cladophialophora chaetospira TaxID=386627 RepID=A0AA38X0X4_9EURO|nr:hypothetical protein H2200_010888 [Cladophialophora chaetospira]
MYFYWSRDVLVQICTIVLAPALIGAVEVGQFPLIDSPELAVSQACQTLASRFPKLVSFPGDRSYQSQQDLYWAANQADLTPTCRFAPTSSDEVSQFIIHLIDFDERIHFSIVSGGHATAFGASNLNGGITLDLSSLGSVTLADDRSYVEIGTGARWADVYELLDPLGLSIAGGRAGSVGVGGYLLGGGISLFSSLLGWGADSLEALEVRTPFGASLSADVADTHLALNVQVVLPNGTTVTTSYSKHPDLFICLKGGANNFGVATSFRMKTFPIPNGLVDVTFLGYAHEQLPNLLAALANFTKYADTDPASASAELSIGFDASNPGQGMVHVLMLASVSSGSSAESEAREDAESLPALWKPFLDITVLHTSRWRAPMGYLAQKIEADNPYGYRVYKNTLTIHNNAVLLREITDVFITAVQRASKIPNDSETRDSAFQVGMLIQPLPLPHLHHARDKGQRNLMGLEDEDAPLILLAFEIHYLSANHDEKLISLLDEILRKAETRASLRGALHPFMYINYAAKGQDVWATLREKGLLNEVKAVQRRYDPTGVWKRRLRGGFKIE